MNPRLLGLYCIFFNQNWHLTVSTIKQHQHMPHHWMAEDVRRMECELILEFQRS